MTGMREETQHGRYCRKFDEAIERNPPRITWTKNKRGVMVAAEIDDPHAETPNKPKESA